MLDFNNICAKSNTHFQKLLWLSNVESARVRHKLTIKESNYAQAVAILYPFPVEVSVVNLSSPEPGLSPSHVKLSFPPSIILKDLLHLDAANPHTVLYI